MNQTINDWVERHQLTADLAHRCLFQARNRSFSAPEWLRGRIALTRDGAAVAASREVALERFVKPAFAPAFGAGTLLDRLIARIEFTGFDASAPGIPHVIDRGPGVAPRIALGWSGTPADLLCLAHETAHALQIMFSAHAFMPPVARETCAFLGELLLLDHLRNTAPTLFAAASAEWQRDDLRYLGADAAALEAALGDGATPYHYRMNYPLARLSAMALYQDKGVGGILPLFTAGSRGMEHLPLKPLAARAEGVENDLPAYPEAIDTLAAYRALGAMAALDLLSTHGPPEQSMADYYTDMRDPVQNHQAFVMLDEGHRPAGYALWHHPDEGSAPKIARYTAPFANLAKLKATLARHLERTPNPPPALPECAPTEPGASQQLDCYVSTGYALELLAASDHHRGFRLGAYFRTEILPALRCGQMRFYTSSDGVPLAKFTWAWLSPEVEAAVLATGRALRAEEWQSGNRLFFNDCIAPYGDLRAYFRDLMAVVFPGQTSASSLRRNPDGSVRRVNRWHRPVRQAQGSHQTGSHAQRGIAANQDNMPAQNAPARVSPGFCGAEMGEGRVQLPPPG